MKTFFHSLEEIEQTTAQLQHLPCPHCRCERHLLSHGYIYKHVPGQPPMRRRLISFTTSVSSSSRFAP